MQDVSHLFVHLSQWSQYVLCIADELEIEKYQLAYSQRYWHAPKVSTCPSSGAKKEQSFLKSILNPRM